MLQKSSLSLIANNVLNTMIRIKGVLTYPIKIWFQIFACNFHSRRIKSPLFTISEKRN